MTAIAESSGNPLPPSYTDGLEHIGSDFDANLPAYGQSQQAAPRPRPVVQRATKEFNYPITKGGHSFLVMTLISTGPSQNTPIFLEGSPVKGKIQLHLKKNDPIASIVLTVKGEVLVSRGGMLDDHGGYTASFLDKKHTVWSQEEQQNKAALSGDHSWPFSIDLPEEVELTEGAEPQPKKFRLPQTFQQRFVRSTIKYEIAVKVTRRGILRSSDELKAPFIFIPVVAPPPLPPLRRLAYEEGTPLLGPKVDPNGWYLEKTVKIEGTLFNNRSASAECRLFLAKPLAYTRGSIIPLFITFESDDKQLLDLLSSPQAPSVRVRRHITCSSQPHKAVSEAKVWRNEIDHSQRAVWWHATDYSGQEPPDRLRMLSGELHLKPDMTPTSAIVSFRLNYSVVLFPPNTPGFKVEGRAPLLEQSITIVTSFAPGPRPRATTPADYTPDSKIDAEELQTNGEFSHGFY